MDSPPPPAPPVIRAAGLPADTCTASPFATGNAPGWTLTRCADHLLLRIVGVPMIRLDRPAWHDGPAGRRLTAVDPAGRAVSLTIAHGRCRDAGGQPATLSIGGRSLPGCLLDSGDRPYGGDR